MGERGERLTLSYLKRNGFKILETNWRDIHTEIDIIAVKKKELHIIEVKSRTTESWEAIGASLTSQKIRALRRGSIRYITKNPKYTDYTIIFDVAALFFDSEMKHKIEFVEDVRF
ncbi:MAG: YraN family protein [Rikenellaceae bacterium]